MNLIDSDSQKVIISFLRETAFHATHSRIPCATSLERGASNNWKPNISSECPRIRVAFDRPVSRAPRRSTRDPERNTAPNC